MKNDKPQSFTLTYRWNKFAERHLHFWLLARGRDCTLRSKLAFTMAEILISLTIIGIIAAITLPSLRANINEKTWATQRKALYSRMSQAISMMPSLNGYGIAMNENGAINYTSTNQKAALAFVTDGLNKVLKINNICDSSNLKNCGIPDKITVMGTNNKIDFPTNLTELNPMFTSTYTTTSNVSYTNPQKDINTVTAAFETGNGESVAVFYNPVCQPDMGETHWHYSQPKMCVNFIYDLNGRKGPNKVGKDIGFITALYPTDPNIVAPMPLEKNAKSAMAHAAAAAACKAQDPDSRVPNRDELTAMFYNKQLMNIQLSQRHFWSGSVVSPGMAWFQFFILGTRGVHPRSDKYYVRCIKR